MDEGPGVGTVTPGVLRVRRGDVAEGDAVPRPGAGVGVRRLQRAAAGGAGEMPGSWRATAGLLPGAIVATTGGSTSSRTSQLRPAGR